MTTIDQFFRTQKTFAVCLASADKKVYLRSDGSVLIKDKYHE